MPTLPFPKMSKRVAFVEEATTKSGFDAAEPVEVETERAPQGVEVPKPNKEVVVAALFQRVWVKAS
jgi:hypothetical protein